MNPSSRKRSARTIDAFESTSVPMLERKRDRLVRSVTRHISSARQLASSVQRLSERRAVVLGTMSREA